MADTERQDRTQPATEKRLQDARSEGRIPRSRDLTAAAVMLTAGIALKIVGDSLARRLGEMMRGGLSISRDRIFDETISAMKKRGELASDDKTGIVPGAGSDGYTGHEWLERFVIARDAETGELHCEITEDGQEVILVNGGRGGLGNAEDGIVIFELDRHNL